MTVAVTSEIVPARWGSAPGGPDDPRWAQLPVVRLVDARAERDPVHTTDVRFADDGSNLWVLFDCAATDIRVTMTRYKDKVWTEGAVEVFLRPPGADWLAEFQVSPIATRRDLRVLDPGGPGQFYDESWNCDGFSAVTRLLRTDQGDLTGWAALMCLPWASVAPGATPPTTAPGWRIGVFRWEYSPLEFSGLARHPEHDAHSDHFLIPLGHAERA